MVETSRGSTDPLPGWVTAPELRATWQQIANRLEASGLVTTVATQTTFADPATRLAIEDLLGRRLTGVACRVDVAALDARLRARAGAGVVAVAESVLGRPLIDRPARRNRVAAGRRAPFVEAEHVLAGTHLEAEEWVRDWLAAVRADGLLPRLDDPVPALIGAVRVLLALTGEWPGRGRRTRTELAAEVLHDSHGLDDDRPASRLVLRALSRRFGRPHPIGAWARRALWDEVGVLPDLVSTSCATLGVAWTRDAPADSAVGRGPRLVTGWDLRRLDLVAVEGQDVLVCENPSVLQAFAERPSAAASVVCTSGRPNLVVQDVLERLATAGARLRYHGDFDWPGVAIANDVMVRFGAQPWLMSAADYDAAPGDLPLDGLDDVEPVWDRGLGPAMRRRGRAVHEEAVVEQMLASWPGG